MHPTVHIHEFERIADAYDAENGRKIVKKCRFDGCEAVKEVKK